MGGNDTVKILYLNAGVFSKTHKVYPWLTTSEAGAHASVSAFHVALHGDTPLGHVKVDALQVSASADLQSAKVAGVDIPLYAGAEAHANLVSVAAGPVSANIGVGVDTEAGINHGSVTAEIEGTGVTFGTKIGISVLGSGVSVDLKKVFAKVSDGVENELDKAESTLSKVGNDVKNFFSGW